MLSWNASLLASSDFCVNKTRIFKISPKRITTKWTHYNSYSSRTLALVFRQFTASSWHLLTFNLLKLVWILISGIKNRIGIYSSESQKLLRLIAPEKKKLLIHLKIPAQKKNDGRLTNQQTDFLWWNARSLIKCGFHCIFRLNFGMPYRLNRKKIPAKTRQINLNIQNKNLWRPKEREKNQNAQCFLYVNVNLVLVWFFVAFHTWNSKVEI